MKSAHIAWSKSARLREGEEVLMFAGTARYARILVVLAALGVWMIVGTNAAQAVSFELTGDHCTGGCGTPPFGTVTLTQNDTTVDVTVHLFAGEKFVKTGSVDFQAFKFNAIGVDLTDITVDAHAPTLQANTGAFNGNGTGNFSFGISCPSCGGGASDAFKTNIVFHVADAAIGDFVANNLGIFFVADILGTTGNTGPVYATGPVTPVPEPATLFLIGTGMVGIGMWRKRRSNAA